MKRLRKLYLLYRLKEAGEEFIDDFQSSDEEVKMSKDLEELREKCLNCNLCDLSKTRTNVVFGEGNENAEVMFIGEAPGEMEDLTGRPFVGRAGKLLTKFINEVLNLQRDDIYIANIVKCRPPNNRVPTIEEAESCKPYLISQIDIIDPKLIVCLGKTAVKYLLGVDEPMRTIRGKIFEFKGKEVIVTYHPSYLLRNPSAKIIAQRDFELIKSKL